MRSTFALAATLAAFLAPSAAAGGGGYNERVLRAVFGPYGSQAVAVARCESGLSTSARNGQYLGIMQLGAAERARYGHGPDVWSQARAAYRYFVASGRNWSPWQCKPWR